VAGALLPGLCAAAAHPKREGQGVSRLHGADPTCIDFLGLGPVKTGLPNVVFVVSRVLRLGRDNTPQTQLKLLHQTRPKRFLDLTYSKNCLEPPGLTCPQDARRRQA
jgi:hypothetical protein